MKNNRAINEKKCLIYLNYNAKLYDLLIKSCFFSQDITKSM